MWCGMIWYDKIWYDMTWSTLLFQLSVTHHQCFHSKQCDTFQILFYRSPLEQLIQYWRAGCPRSSVLTNKVRISLANQEERGTSAHSAVQTMHTVILLRCSHTEVHTSEEEGGGGGIACRQRKWKHLGCFGGHSNHELWETLHSYINKIISFPALLLYCVFDRFVRLNKIPNICRFYPF